MSTVVTAPNPIGFALTDEQKQLQDTARKFAADVIRPVAPHHDRTEEFPEKVLRKAHEVGLMNLIIPAEYGGMGISAVDGVIATEESAWGCAGIATSLMANDLALSPIVLDASEEQKKEWLPKFQDYRLASFCLSEPSAGSDVAGMQTTCRREGDYYILNGSKQWITNATYADQFTVFASLDKSKRHKSLCAFIVDAKTPGITVGKPEDKMGQRASNTAPITFEDVKVPVANRIGEEGQGWMIAMRTLDKSRPMVAAICVGIARAAMEHAVDYSKERKQFGEPIANFQGIQFLIANMAMKTQASRLLTWQAAWALDQGQRASLYSSYAKSFAADTCMEVTTDAVQVFGGYGYTKEYPVEKLMRDAKLMQIYEGTAQVQRMVIAREIIKGNV
jgi:acyl-CoA dehydrogenase